MQTEANIMKLDVNLIIPNKYQPRKVFEDSTLNSLAESIKNYGIINPILVRKKNDKYEIIAGERRFRAAKKLGLNEVPVIVKDANEQQMAELALIENIQRQGLSPIEEAKSYEEIMRIGNQTQTSLAAKLGKSQAAIANKIRLLSLPEEIQLALNNKEISERHARSLITVSDKEKQLELLDRIIKEKLTVKETERIINEKEITETEIKQAISDIMKSLNIEETDEIKKEEKDDDNMNNGNFFPNFDNNQTNNNSSLNMMNMQSMNQPQMEPVQETVMPTMSPIGFETNTMQPQMPSFEPMGQPTFTPNESNFQNETNQMDNFMVTQQNTMPTVEPQIQEPLLFAQSNEQMPMQEIQPMSPEVPVMAPQMTDVPLFNPNVNISQPMQESYFASPLEPISQPPVVEQEPQIQEPTGFDIPLTPMMNNSNDRLSELQNILSNSGYNYKVFSNETENCVIIELPKN